MNTLKNLSESSTDKVSVEFSQEKEYYLIAHVLFSGCKYSYSVCVNRNGDFHAVRPVGFPLKSWYRLLYRCLRVVSQILKLESFEDGVQDKD